jgi:hypothetical protein
MQEFNNKGATIYVRESSLKYLLIAQLVNPLMLVDA